MNKEAEITSAKQDLAVILKDAANQDSAAIAAYRRFGSSYRIEQWTDHFRKACALITIGGSNELIEAEVAL